MIRFNNQKMRESKCSVCGQSIMVDEVGNGDICGNCGWVEDAYSKKFPNSPSPIVISLNKARRLYNEKRLFKPDFEDFIDLYEMYGEVEFTYNGIIYGMAGAVNDAVQFWACDVPVKQRIPIIFASIDDFIANAKIDGILVKDLWDKVEESGTLK